jgi:hypothetical protein
MMDASTDPFAVMEAALPASIDALARLATDANPTTARQTIDLLIRHLWSGEALRATAAAGSVVVVRQHLDALRWLEAERRALDNASTAH